jgi:hypothetical protein
VLKVLWTAERTAGRDGRAVEAPTHDGAIELPSRYGRLSEA